MKILLLEDRGSVAFYMKELLETEGYDVVKAYSIGDADDIIDHDGIDCIICDLNMDPYGLPPQQYDETREGLLTGWIWLRDKVFQSKPEMKKRTIIYSEYIQALRAAVSEDQLTGIRLVLKSGSNSSAERVLRYVEDIAKTIKR